MATPSKHGRCQLTTRGATGASAARSRHAGSPRMGRPRHRSARPRIFGAIFPRQGFCHGYCPWAFAQQVVARSVHASAKAHIYLRFHRGLPAFVVPGDTLCDLRGPKGEHHSNQPCRARRSTIPPPNAASTIKSVNGRVAPSSRSFAPFTGASESRRSASQLWSRPERGQDRPRLIRGIGRPSNKRLCPIIRLRVVSPFNCMPLL